MGNIQNLDVQIPHEIIQYVMPRRGTENLAGRRDGRQRKEQRASANPAGSTRIAVTTGTERTSRTLTDTGPDMGCTSPTAPLVDTGFGTTRGTSRPPSMHTRQGTDTRGRTDNGPIPYRWRY